MQWSYSSLALSHQYYHPVKITHSLTARFMGPTWGPSGADRTQVGPCWPHGLCYLGWGSFRVVHSLLAKHLLAIRAVQADCAVTVSGIWNMTEISTGLCEPTMHCCWPGNKPLSDLMMTSFINAYMHPRPQWFSSRLNAIWFIIYKYASREFCQHWLGNDLPAVQHQAGLLLNWIFGTNLWILNQTR